MKKGPGRHTGKGEIREKNAWEVKRDEYWEKCP